jgi:asparagine synthase (glutamine-hydrolysing)
VSPEDIVGLFPLLIQWYDEPFADTSAFPTYCVSRFAREQLKVVLTGDGGDEVFGGYRWYAEFSKRPVLSGNYRNIIWSFVHAMKMRYRGSLIGKIMNRVEYNVLGQGFPLYAKLLGGMLGEEKARYRECWKIPRDYDDYWSFRRYYRPDLPLFTRLQYLDFHTYLPDDILTKVDRASMAVSLEARVPLLGKELVEFCFSLSEAVRLPNAEPKGLVRYAYRGELPKAILQRPKRGFSIPWSRWRPEPTGKGLKKQEQILHSLYKPLLAQS